MKTFILSFVFLFLLGSAQAQSQLKQTPPKRKSIQLPENQSNLQVKTGKAELSNYFGYDNKIKEISLDGNIPSNFPTREAYSDKKQYLNYINEWIKVNQSLIKPEFKNTTLKD